VWDGGEVVWAAPENEGDDEGGTGESEESDEENGRDLWEGMEDIGDEESDDGLKKRRK
jgi:hypothetical protein